MIATKTEQAARGKILSMGLLVATFMAACLLLTATKPAHAATTFTVNSTRDGNDLDFPGGTFDGSSDGQCFTGQFVQEPGSNVAPAECTLRAAIQQANSTAGADTIAFAIRGPGPHTISPAGSPLPTIFQQVTIDGYTESLDESTPASPNTATTGTNAVLKIELDGTNAGNAHGLALLGTTGASNSVIRGLVINDFLHSGIQLSGGKGYKVEGNFIGTGPSGTSAEGNEFGVAVVGTNNTVGGASPEARNLISGNDRHGVSISASGTSTTGNKIQGNLIGTDKNGVPLGNGESGVGLFQSQPGDVNTGNRILSNSIFSNNGLGIDLGVNGVTANDGDDPSTSKPDPDKDTGPNNLQNSPVITSAQIFEDFFGDTTTIVGELTSTPSTRKKRTFTIQFFSSPQKDPSGFGEGKTFLGEIQVKTDRQGKAPISFSTQAVSEGEFVTATATNNKTGDTSEFSNARVVAEPGVGGG